MTQRERVRAAGRRKGKEEEKMENTPAINILFVESLEPCCVDGCGKPCKILDLITGKRFCEQHAPRLWVEEAIRNDKRIEQERQAILRPCVVW